MEANQYLNMARRWWWLVLIGVLMAVAAYGVAVQLRDTATPAYTATATFFVSDQPSLGQTPKPVAVAESVRTDAMVNTYAEIIESESVAERMISRLGLAASPSEIKDRIDVHPVNGTQLIRVTTFGATAAEAEELSDGIVQSFNALRDDGQLPGYTYLVEAGRAQQDTPVEREQWKYVLLVAVFGLITAASIVLVFEFATDLVRDAPGAEAATAVPVLARVPVSDGSAGGQIAALSHDGRAATMMERFRMLRAGIGVAAGGDPPQVIAIVAPGPRCGATLTAANLAVVLAQAGRRVALVDANLRSPMLHRIFDLSPERTLVDAFARSSAPASIACPTQVEHLSLIAAGVADRHPADLIDGERFGRLLDALVTRFDHIVIDMPPLLQAAEALVVASMADHALLVVRTDWTPRQEATEAAAMLRRAGVEVLGTVVNGEPAGGGFAPGLRMWARRRSAGASA